MPSIEDGSSTSRQYAPHMYILSQDGDPDNDGDYVFVGNSVASAADWETKTEYNAGVSITGELVCDMITGYLTNDRRQTGISFEDVPDGLKAELIDKALSQVGTRSGQILLNGLGIEVPKDMEPIDSYEWINGSPNEQVAEEAKRRRWRIIEAELRTSLESE